MNVSSQIRFGDSSATAREETDSSGDALSSSFEAPTVCCEQEQSVVDSGVRHTQNDDGVFLNDSRGDADRELGNDLSIAPSTNRDGAQASRLKSASSGVVTKTVATRAIPTDELRLVLTPLHPIKT